MFKLHNPSNRYVLNLEDAYERAICLKLLNVAATSSYYTIDDMRYKPLNSNCYESIVLKQLRYTLIWYWESKHLMKLLVYNAELAFYIILIR